jgi:hypothetical protein
MKNRGIGPFKWGDLRTELKENTEFDIKKFVTSLDTKERAELKILMNAYINDESEG